jgi:hypothetical protein
MNIDVGAMNVDIRQPAAFDLHVRQLPFFLDVDIAANREGQH